MAGISGISINPAEYGGNFALDLFLSQFYLQHLALGGEERCGLAVCTKKGILKTTSRPGLLRPNFGRELEQFGGTAGIGYCGLASEPYQVNTWLGQISICLSGKINNIGRIRTEAGEHGAVFFDGGGEAETIAHILLSERDLPSGIIKLSGAIEGSCSFLALTKQGIYVFQHPDVYFPLVLGEKKGAIIVASESGGFPNAGFRRTRDITPGELVLLKDGKWELVGEVKPQRKPRMCGMVWAFYAFSASVIEGRPVSAVRRAMAAALARRDIKNGLVPDIVAPVPNIGRSHALGYHQEFCRQLSLGSLTGPLPLYDEPLSKYTFASRDETLRLGDREVGEIFIKIVQNGEDYTGRRLVLCTDSIAMGRRIKEKLIPTLRAMGFSKIYLRSSFPKIVSPCSWMGGIRGGKLLVASFATEQERADFLRVDDLAYNTVDDFVASIGMPREALCLDCCIP